MARVPEWVQEIMYEDELEAAENGQGFENSNVVFVEEDGTTHEVEALIEYLDPSRNPTVEHNVKGPRIYLFEPLPGEEKPRETFAFKSREEFEESSQKMGAYIAD